MSNLQECDFIKIDLSRRIAFISAWEAAFERQLSPKIYNWIFDENNLVYAAICDKKIVAGYCLYPMDAVVNATFRKACLANNGFVIPEYRRNNLFVRLSQFSLRDAGSNGISIAYGISNEHALPGHKKVGWSVLPTLQFLEKKRVTHPRKDGVSWCEAPLNDVQRADIACCSRRSSFHRLFSIIKSPQFIRWRYESRPDVKYWFGLQYQDNILRAYCVCKYFSEKKWLHFIDIDGDSSGAVETLIESAQLLDMPFTSSNVWSFTAHSKLFLDQGYKEMPSGRHFILIQPSDLSGIDVIGDINLVLGDNDVF